MLGQRLRRWPSIKPSSDPCPALAWTRAAKCLSGIINLCAEISSMTAARVGPEIMDARHSGTLSHRQLLLALSAKARQPDQSLLSAG